MGLSYPPLTNHLSLNLENDNAVIIRPSGTEPKIKLYITAVGKTKDEALDVCDSLVKSAKETANFEQFYDGKWYYFEGYESGSMAIKFSKINKNAKDEYTFDGDVCVGAERVYTFPNQMSALRHYRDAIEKAELYDNIEMFNNQVRYKLKDTQYQLETKDHNKHQLKAKFDKQIADAKADMAREKAKRHEHRDHHEK